MLHKSLYQLLWKNLIIYILFFIGLVVFGTLGYYSFEHVTLLDALYMTVITMATVGYNEAVHLDERGRIFTIIFILLNLGVITFVITKTSGFLLDGDFMRLYKLIKMQNKIEKLKNHVIICGFGRNGSKAYHELKNKGIQVVVVDKTIPKDEIEFYVEDDATNDQALIRAGIMHARFIICALPNDAQNVYIVLSAKELNPEIITISRASNESSVKKLKLAGANNVIMPDVLGGAHMANLVLMPDVKEFMDYMYSYDHKHNIVELETKKTTKLSALNCWQNTGALLLGIKKQSGEYLINPTADTTIQPGDRLIVLANSEQIALVKEYL